jgi:hypothetical protein
VHWDRNKITWFIDDQNKRADYLLWSSRALPHYLYDVECDPAGKKYYVNEIYPKDPMNIVFDVTVMGTKDNTTPNQAQMEVDWVQYYKQLPCEDILITNSSPFPISSQYPDLYNVLGGRSVTINRDLFIGNMKQLDVIASSEITIYPGFEAVNGSKFEARIDNFCNIQQHNPRNISILKNTNDNDWQNELENDVVIYPNPNQGIFTIESKLPVQKIEIFDMLGKMVYAISNIYNRHTIQLSSEQKGVFVICIISENNKITKKLIVQ